MKWPEYSFDQKRDCLRNFSAAGGVAANAGQSAWYWDSDKRLAALDATTWLENHSLDRLENINSLSEDIMSLFWMQGRVEGYTQEQVLTDSQLDSLLLGLNGRLFSYALQKLITEPLSAVVGEQLSDRLQIELQAVLYSKVMGVNNDLQQLDSFTRVLEWIRRDLMPYIPPLQHWISHELQNNPALDPLKPLLYNGSVTLRPFEGIIRSAQEDWLQKTKVPLNQANQQLYNDMIWLVPALKQQILKLPAMHTVTHKKEQFLNLYRAVHAQLMEVYGGADYIPCITVPGITDFAYSTTGLSMSEMICNELTSKINIAFGDDEADASRLGEDETAAVMACLQAMVQKAALVSELRQAIGTKDLPPALLYELQGAIYKTLLPPNQAGISDCQAAHAAFLRHYVLPLTPTFYDDIKQKSASVGPEMASLVAQILPAVAPKTIPAPLASTVRKAAGSTQARQRGVIADKPVQVSTKEFSQPLTTEQQATALSTVDPKIMASMYQLLQAMGALSASATTDSAPVSQAANDPSLSMVLPLSRAGNL